MPRFAPIWRKYIVPAMVFQSIMIGGGYGTGREIVEYFSRYGAGGGLLGLAVVCVGFAILLPIGFEVARAFRAYDYRRFFRELLGRGWIAFEVFYLVMLALVLAVVASASGTLIEQHLRIPPFFGNALLLIAVMLVAFYGRIWVMRVLAYKALALCAVFVVYVAVVLTRSGAQIASEVTHFGIESGWLSAALRYTLYSSIIIPVMLFATRELETRRDAILAGGACALLGIAPAVLMHISFQAGAPQVLTESLPTYWMISRLGEPVLTAAYLAILLGSLFDVGVGFIQSINERLDGWSLERRGRPLPRGARALTALGALIASGALSLFGIVALVAQGYGTMAYGSLVLFIVPLFTVGLYKVRKNPVPLPPSSSPLRNSPA